MTEYPQSVLKYMGLNCSLYKFAMLYKELTLNEQGLVKPRPSSRSDRL